MDAQDLAPTSTGSVPCGQPQDSSHHNNNTNYVELERRVVLRNLAMTADKLARMSMAASVGAGLNAADYGQFSRSLEDMNGCIHQLCRAYQLQEPALPPSPLHHGEEAPTPTSSPGNEFDESPGGSEVSTFKRHRPSNRARPDKACLECGRRDTAQWRRGPLGVSTLCNACGIRHARVMKKVQRQQLMRLGISPGCTPPLPDEASDSQPIVPVAHQGQHHHHQQHPHSRHLRDSWPVSLSSDDERDATDHHAQLPQHAGRSSVYALLN